MLSCNVQISSDVTFVTPEPPATPLPPGAGSKDVLDDLKHQTHLIRDTKPSFSALAKRYQDQKSCIDQFVEWYVNSSWWGKILEGVLVVSASYTLGIFLGLTWVLSALAAVLYVGAMSIMEEHAAMIQKRNELFLEDVSSMEASLMASVESFRISEKQLNKVFQSQGVLHEERFEKLEILKENVDTAETHNARYAAVVERLGGVTVQLEAYQAELALEQVDVEALAKTLKNNISEVQSLSFTLSGLVSAAEQSIIASKKPTVIATPHEGNHVLACADQALDDFKQRFAKLQSRQASSVCQASVTVVPQALNIVSMATHNFF